MLVEQPYGCSISKRPPHPRLSVPSGLPSPRDRGEGKMVGEGLLAMTSYTPCDPCESFLSISASSWRWAS